MNHDNTQNNIKPYNIILPLSALTFNISHFEFYQNGRILNVRSNFEHTNMT
ncbi:MAG: hypothetical protein LBL41_05305 [Bifidobacteriaceae bacterium]|nr:hypothetical protein [Bifidobacteriaceae bacterium]